MTSRAGLTSDVTPLRAERGARGGEVLPPPLRAPTGARDGGVGISTPPSRQKAPAGRRVQSPTRRARSEQ